jgi:hypothetical protein
MTIPINNLGVWVEATGAHQNNVEVLFGCDAAANSQGITNADANFIMLNIADPNGNGGDISDNEFLLHWRMGTQDNASMHVGSMFDQIANGDFGPGTYLTVVTLTMNAH